MRKPFIGTFLCLLCVIIFLVTVIQTADAATIDYSSGFSGSGITLNGSATYSGSSLQLTNIWTSQAASAFYNTPVNVQSFTTDFTIWLTNPVADGMTFVIQNQAPTAMGDTGGALGYAGDGGGLAGSLLGGGGGTPGITHSIAIKFDLYDNNGEGSNSTGLYANGAQPTTPADPIAAVNLHSGNPIKVHLAYDGASLAMTMKDTVTGATFSKTWTIDIPATVGASTAYVGFTAGTGGRTATQRVIDWTLTDGAQPPPPPPPPVAISISPYASSLLTGATQQFSATVTGASDPTVAWQVASGGGSISSSGLYTAPSLAGTATVKAISLADPTKTASATVTINAASTCTTGDSTWKANPLASSQSGAFSVSFDATPQANAIDSVIAFSPGAPSAYTDLAAIIRFSPAGIIDVRNGGTYAVDSLQAYSANSTYHFPCR